MLEVYLHGFACTPSMWQPLWVAQDALGPHPARRALALPFHGGPNAHNFAQACDLLWAELEAAPDPVHLVGYSLGGRLALHMALRRPHRVHALTLLGAHPGLKDPNARNARVAHDAAWQQLLRQGSLRAFYEAWDGQPLFVQGASTEAHQDARAALDPMLLARSFDVLGLGVMPSAWEYLARLTVPVHLLAGALDLKFAALARQVASHLPHATVTLVPGAHHRVALEAPNHVACAMHTMRGRLSPQGH